MADVSQLQGVMHPVNAGGMFAIVSGENPKHIPEVMGGHKGLEQLLAQSGMKYEATDGDYGDNIHSPVFIVHGVGRDAAMELGRKMGQESVVFSDKGQHQLIYTNGPNAGKFHPAAQGAAMQIFSDKPGDGLTTRVPGLGHVRFHFDHGKLIDVPKKGSAMSEDTTKNEVSVTDLKKKLADTIKRSIENLSKSMEGYAAREVEQNDGASIGDLKLAKSQLSLQSSNEEWMEELSKSAVSLDNCPICGLPDACPCLLKDVAQYAKLTKSHTLAVASAMQRVYQNYLRNVAQPMFPDDPESAHKVALQAAKDWASRAKNPSTIYHTALGYNPDDPKATEAALNPPAAEAPDSMGPSVPPKEMGKAEMCKACKSEMCKCGMQKKVSDTQRRKDTAANIHALKGLPMDEKERNAAIEREKKTSAGLKAKWKTATKAEWKAELEKEELLQKPPTTEAQRRLVHARAKQGVKWAKEWASKDPGGKLPERAEKSETFIDDKNAGARPKSTDEAKKGGPRVKDVGMETPNVAPPTKPVPGNLDDGSGGTDKDTKPVKKAGMNPSNPAAMSLAPNPATSPAAAASKESFTQRAGQSTLPAPGKWSQGAAQTTAPAMPKVAPHSTVSPGPGRSAAGIRGTLIREELAMAETPATPGPMVNDANAPAMAPLAQAQTVPEAKPPTAKPTKLPISKPKLPKAPKLGKGAIPLSGRPGAGSIQAGAQNAAAAAGPGPVSGKGPALGMGKDPSSVAPHTGPSGLELDIPKAPGAATAPAMPKVGPKLPGVGGTPKMAGLGKLTGKKS